MAALGVGAACLLPILFLVIRSEPGRWAAFWRADPGLTGSLAVSLAISTMVALMATAVGWTAGRFVAYHRRRRALLLLAYVPFVISPVVAGVCLLYFYIRIGLSGGVTGVVAAQLLFAMGFAIVFFQGFWNEEKRALEDLARTLGSTPAQIYGRVLLPISRPMLMLCFFQTFLVSWFQYGLTLLIGSGRVRTLPLKVYDYLGEANVAYAALGSCLLVAPAAAVLWGGRWLLARGTRDVS